MGTGKHFMDEPKQQKTKPLDFIILLIVILVLVTSAIWLTIYTLPDYHRSEPSKATSDQTISAAEAARISEEPTSSVDKSKIKLVNRSNFVESDYVPELREISNGLFVSTECWGYLKTMLGACEAAGKDPVVCSAYRPYEEQEALFNEKYEELLPKYDYNEKAAHYEAQRYVALPGASEHQLGLAVDIVDIDNQNLETYQEDTPTQLWLINNSWKYGFILRYPNGADNWTGVKYEPWHYRFVGVDAAKEIHDQGVCLEQYLQGKPK